MRGELAGVRLLLVNPGIYDDVRARGYPPWGILYVASACREMGAEVHVADLDGEQPSLRVPELVSRFEPNVVGVSGKLGKGAERMRQVVEAAEAATDAPAAVGGPLVSAFPQREHALWDGVRGLFWGDGETEFPRWIADGCPRTDAVRPGAPADLDQLGIPSWWDGLGDYVADGEHWPGLEVRSVHVSAARGCTRRCTFCYLNAQHPGRTFRVVHPRRLLEGCDALHERWGVEGFYFVDDCLLRPGHPESDQLLSMLIRRGSPYRFGCDVQIQELADVVLLERMHAAGFRALYVGIEAASARVRRRLGKGVCPVPMVEALDRAMQVGFVIRASVGIGWPDETEAEMEDTLEVIKALPALAIDAFRYTPLPGAPLTTYWARRGGVADGAGPPLDPYADYSEFSRNHSLVPDARLDVMWDALLDLERGRHEAYFRQSAP